MRCIKIDMVGKRFGRLLVLEEHPEKRFGRWQYRCLCDCGNERVVDGNRLRTGGCNSCGCLKIEATKKSNSTHGLSKHPLYSVWGNIWDRCYNPQIDCYKNYGGRGIRMAELWRNDPVVFINWCLENGWMRGLEVDRRNNDGDYEPDNIRFITHKEQQRNTRKNVFFTHQGQTKCLAEWAETLGINYITVCVRIRRGWSMYEALFGKKDKKTWKNLSTS